MAIVEHPLSFLIIALFLLLGLLIFFKIIDFLFARAEKKKKKSESKAKPVEKKEEKIADNKKSEDKPECTQTVENIEVNHNINTVSNGYNYLYDRFVENPTNEDKIGNKETSRIFLSDEEYNRIRNERIEIKVKEDSSLNRKIDSIVKGNNSEKERLLGEFDNLSKEMKLLIIENILKNY